MPMKIKTLSYSQHEGKPVAWSCRDLVLHPKINLIVGKNASGKTKIYRLLENLVLLLSGQKRELFSSGHWDLTFEAGEQKHKQEVRYRLGVEQYAVSEESLWIEGENKLQRGADGRGRLFYEGVAQHLDFQIARHELAAAQKRDAIQHPYLETLCGWAESALAYSFATDMGRHSLFTDTEIRDATGEAFVGEGEQRFAKNAKNVIEVFSQGMRLQGFVEQVQADMKSIGYDLEQIQAEPITDATIRLHDLAVSQGQAQCLFVKERGSDAILPQHALSQGMFRALSLIVHLNFAERSESHRPTCILIDDIGEGLDFERSTRLIQCLINKVGSERMNNDVQLIMTTNDRFVMNKVPLDYWIVIERTHRGLRFYQRHNAPAVFEAFELVGLNHFDFFSKEFYKEADPDR